LNEYVGGTRTLDDALGVVHLTRTLARQLEAEMQLPFGTYNRRRAYQFLVDQAPSERPVEHSYFLVAFHRFNALGEKYFNYEAKSVEVDTAAAGEQVVTQEVEGIGSHSVG
jgi:hypothetical protein